MFLQSVGLLGSDWFIDSSGIAYTNNVLTFHTFLLKSVRRVNLSNTIIFYFTDLNTKQEAVWCTAKQQLYFHLSSKVIFILSHCITLSGYHYSVMHLGKLSQPLPSPEELSPLLCVLHADSATSLPVNPPSPLSLFICEPQALSGWERIWQQPDLKQLCHERKNGVQCIPEIRQWYRDTDVPPLVNLSEQIHATSCAEMVAN